MKTRFALIVISALLLMPHPAHATESAGRDPVSRAVPEAASRSLDLINRERAAAALGSLTLDEEVTGIAARWSRHMAADGRLSHNDDYLSQNSLKALNATVLGENVAYADTVETIHETLMESPPHRRNILHRDYRLVGIAAVVADDGRMYLTQDFLTRQSTTATDAPAPRHSEPPRSRPSARPTRTTAAAARPAAPARPPAPMPATAPAEASARASTAAPGPTAPSPAPQTIPASTPQSAEPAPPVSAPTDAAVTRPASPVVDHTGKAEPRGGDSAPDDMLKAVPLLALALRPRPTRLSG